LYIELVRDIVQGENAMAPALTHLEAILTQESDQILKRNFAIAIDDFSPEFLFLAHDLFPSFAVIVP
jgi:hypothetical protein